MQARDNHSPKQASGARRRAGVVIQYSEGGQDGRPGDGDSVRTWMGDPVDVKGGLGFPVRDS